MQHPSIGTPVVVTGEDLSPIPYDVPDDPKVALPTLTLIRNQELDGTAVAQGAIDQVVYGGEPGSPNADLLRWQGTNQMSFLVKDEIQLDVGTGMFPIGVYDLNAKNPNDENTTIDERKWSTQSYWRSSDPF